MQIHPCAKVNLGLNIVSRRPDGYHNLQTVFFPVGIFDTIDIQEARQTCLTIEGHPVDGDPERNLVMRAYRLMETRHQLPPVSITLSKHIPMQAGMGGGSSDGAFTIRLLNEMFELRLTTAQMQAYALQLGADCPFFITSHPAYAEGIGEQLSPIDLSLSGYCMAIVKPPVAVSTAEAYARIVPRMPAVNCLDVVRKPVDQWRHLLTNDFEESIFPLLPEISRIKQQLYDQGALYAAMSGSGSSVFGIFSQAPTLSFDGCYTAVVELQ